MTRYLRYAALGDSTTHGIGDPVPPRPGAAPGAGWRGWARLLAESLASAYDLSWCNLAVPGATTRCVRERQLGDAVDHRPDLASLVVGVNDTMRSTWDPARLRADLLACASALDDAGALLVGVRFHDHARVLGLPAVLRRPMAARITAVNEVYDEIHARFGGVLVDLARRPEVAERASWSVDRLHPSERGHRVLARAVAEALSEAGLACPAPSLEPAGGLPPDWRREVAWMAHQGAPWVGRRVRDLGPWAVRAAWSGAREGAPLGSRS